METIKELKDLENSIKNYINESVKMLYTNKKETNFLGEKVAINIIASNVITKSRRIDVDRLILSPEVDKYVRSIDKLTLIVSDSLQSLYMGAEKENERGIAKVHISIIKNNHNLVEEFLILKEDMIRLNHQYLN